MTPVRGDGVRHPIESPILGEVTLHSHVPHVAAAVLFFGGRSNDTQAVLMDRFLKVNYGKAGAAPKRFTGTPHFFPKANPRADIDELRLTVKASGKLPIHMVRDLETAAKALEGIEATVRIVTLTCHGFFDADLTEPLLGRVLFGPALSETMLSRLLQIRIQIRKERQEVERAKESNDPERIRDAQKKFDDFLDSLDPDAVVLIEAFEAAADAMDASRVSKVDLQACNSAGLDQTAVPDPFGLASSLGRLLSTKKHVVKVRAHHKMISTFTAGKLNGKEPVGVWIGNKATEEEWSRDASQYSEDTLPVPQ